MNSKIITGLIVSVTILSAVSGMEVTTGNDSMMKEKMMKDEPMVKGTMMEKGKMMKVMTPTTNAGVGSRGEAVTALQNFLIEKGFLTLPVGVKTGYFGPATKRAVMKYQESIGVSATGYFGPKTRMMMQEKMKMMEDTMMKDKMVQ